MHAKTTLIAMTAIALLLAGCNRGATNNAKAANSSAAAPVTPAPAAPAAPVQTAEAGQPVDPAFLTAQPWAPAGMCDNARTFHADGTVTAGDDGGNWELAGSTLTLSQEGNPATEVWTVARNGNDIVMTGPATMTVSPCPAG